MPVYTNALAPRPSNSLAYGPRNLMGTQMLQGPSESYLRQQFPGLYGALGGLLATAPDVMEGSVLDPNTAAVRQAAEYTFPIGTALGMLPAARLTKGLPVGMGIKDVGSKFNVASKDASEIFGAGSARFKYTEPNSGGSIEVLRKSDGSASVLSLEVPEKFRGMKIGESLQAQVMQDFPVLQGQVSSKAAAKTAYRLGRRPPNQPDASLDEVYKIMDEYSSVNLVSPAMQRQVFMPTQAPQQAALDLAQQRAALPPVKGGLGLPKNNTPEQRAAAMGFDTDAYHGTNTSNITKFDLGKSNRGEGTSVALTPENAQAYGNITYPLKVNQQKIFDPTNKDQFNELKSYVENLIQKQKPYDKDSLSFYPFTSKKVLENLTNPQTGSYYLENELISKSLQDLKYAGSIGMESSKSQLKMFDPDLIRSRFAAFDPFRKTAAIAATMGVAAPDLLAAEDDKVGVNKMRKLKANK